MEEELKDLGFEYLEEYKTHVFILKDRCLEININSNRVYVMNQKNIMDLMPYKYEKVKQLIQILS